MITRFFIPLLLAVYLLPHVCESSPRPENLPGVESTVREFPGQANIDGKDSKKGKRILRPASIKKIKASKFDDTDVGIGILLVMAIFFPYIAVGIKYGIDIEFFKCILYTLLLYIPGVVYAIIKVLEKY